MRRITEMEKIGDEISSLSAVLEEQLQCESSEMDRDALRQVWAFRIGGVVSIFCGRKFVLVVGIENWKK